MVGDRPAAHADHIAHHFGQLQIGVFEGLLNPLDMAAVFPHELLPRPRQARSSGAGGTKLPRMSVRQQIGRGRQDW
jgi:hypothetical protein